MKYIFKNFVWSFLSEEVLEVDTVLPVEDTSKFPPLAASEIFMCALHDGEQEPELVKMVLVGEDTLTVERAQEGTTARIWPKGTKVFNSVTAAMFDLVGQPSLVADNVSVTPIGDLSSTNVQDALVELQNDIDATEAGLATVSSDIVDIEAAIAGLGAIYAPIDHGHAIDDVTGLQAELDAKADAVHAHAIADVTGLQTALDAKSNIGHTHTASAVTDFAESVDDRVAALLQEGTNITLIYDDALGTLTINGAGSAGVPDGDKGDITVSGSGLVWLIDASAVTNSKIADDAVTNAKLADVATQTFKGRNTAGTGDPEDLTVAQVKTLLSLAGSNSGDQTITLTGDVTGSGTGSFAATIGNDKVTNAQLANMAASTIKGNNAALGDPVDMTVAQTKALLAYIIGDVSGLQAALDLKANLTANTFTAAQTISSASAGDLFTLTSTDAGATEGPSVSFYRNSASPAVSDVLSVLRWYGKDSAANQQEYAAIYGVIADPTSTSEDGDLYLRTTVAGALTTQLQLRNGVLLGGASGGHKGTGTVNATDYYDDGALLNTIYASLASDNAFTGLQTVTNAGLTPVTVVSTDAGASSGPVLDLYRNSASPLAGDEIGQVDFSGNSSTGVKRQYGFIDCIVDDPTNASEDAKVRLVTIKAGTLQATFTATQGVIVGAPTGGDKGTGTINANEYYRQGAVLAGKNLSAVQFYTAGATWTKPANLDFVIIEVQAGGGSGGGVGATTAGQSAEGGGGGGGGYGIKKIAAASLGATETVTVGAGGTAAAAGSIGNTGGTSSFGAHCSATGGAGGSAMTGGTAQTAAGGGLGGTTTGGDLNVQGGCGGRAERFNGLEATVSVGADSRWGFGGEPQGGNANGNTGVGYGGGGSGGHAFNANPTRSGGAGAPGMVIVYEYSLV